ncbi:MAG: polysaccharide deacetylase family protein [Clostridia bacterium]|nr:polysaccharide deacetylase family protein [Clostridia bacterium]
MKRFSWFAVVGRKGLGAALSIAVATAVLLAAMAVGLPRLAVSAPSEKRLLPVYCTDREGKVVSLTFDAAWGAEDTDRLIEIFDTYDVAVTFFVVGDWVEKFPEEVKKLHDAGHEVMNHSDTHPYMSKISESERAAELKNCNDKIERITGVRPTLFRPPYGDYNNAVIRSVEAAGMTCIQWSVDSLDWKDPSPQEMTQRVLSKVRSGDIVLFHNAAKNTPAALPDIIEALQADGYTFLKVSDMIYADGYRINHEGRQCKT